jgi:uncharacterized membrane protein YjgN (DUF898 family)
MSLRDDYESYKASTNGGPIFNADYWGYTRLIFVNALLTIVTLGIYYFWAKRNTQRFFWSNTQLWQEPLEFTGRVKEIFIGTLVAFFIIIVPLAIIAAIIQASSNHYLIAGLLLAVVISISYLGEYARYSSLNYKLSRTLWRGIRGGMSGSAHAYAAKAFGLNLLTLISLGALAPYAIARKWNLLMNEASFGSQSVTAEMSPKSLYMRALIMAALLALIIVSAVFYKTVGTGLAVGIFVLASFAFFAFALSLHALVWREKLNALRWGDVQFSFNARTVDWFLFWLVISFLTPFTLGILYLFVPILYWKFVCRHLTLSGDPNPVLAQSQTRQPGFEEGISEAMDMGGLM